MKLYRHAFKSDNLQLNICDLIKLIFGATIGSKEAINIKFVWRLR